MLKIKRPAFDDFRDIFLNCLTRLTGRESQLLAGMKWSEIGSLEDRRRMLAEVLKKVSETYGVEFEINQRLLNVEGPVESAVIQAFHEMNTIYLIEKINLKIKSRMN